VRRQKTAAAGEPGPGVDARGQPVIDPTKNVLDLVAAEAKRQDDLRRMSDNHFQQLFQLHRDHMRELRQAEKDRINAIREVDIGAVQRAAEAADTRATVLAGQVSASAETVRVQSAATVASITEGYMQAIRPLIDAVAKLQEQMFRQLGERAQVVETRDVRGSGRSDLTAVMMLVGVVVAIVVGVLGLVLR
jgi:hypothetical protein